MTVADSYDRVAANYAAATRDELHSRPVDRALLAAFAELVTGTVVDFGCGPGHVTAHLHTLGLDVTGVDVSAGMVDVARGAYPSVRFEVGETVGADAALGGLVAFYSIIHHSPDRQPDLFAAMRAALVPTAPLLLAFQVGADEPREITQGFGHGVSLTAWRLDPQRVARDLVTAGFTMLSTTVREPVDASEKVQRAYLLAVAG